MGPFLPILQHMDRHVAIMFGRTDQHVANPAHTLTYGPACCHIMFGWTDRLVAISAHTWSSSVQAALTYYVSGAPGAVILIVTVMDHSILVALMYTTVIFSQKDSQNEPFHQRI